MELYVNDRYIRAIRLKNTNFSWIGPSVSFQVSSIVFSSVKDNIQSEMIVIKSEYLLFLLLYTERIVLILLV